MVRRTARGGGDEIINMERIDGTGQYQGNGMVLRLQTSAVYKLGKLDFEYAFADHAEVVSDADIKKVVLSGFNTTKLYQNAIILFDKLPPSVDLDLGKGYATANYGAEAAKAAALAAKAAANARIAEDERIAKYQHEYQKSGRVEADRAHLAKLVEEHAAWANRNVPIGPPRSDEEQRIRDAAYIRVHGGGRGKTTSPKWTSTGRKVTLKDGSKRALYKKADKPGELRIRRMATRAGQTVATYVKPPK